jgi:multiple sugar transport system ATP-binding protein
VYAEERQNVIVELARSDGRVDNMELARRFGVMIAGLEEISDGELLIDGERVNELAPRDRDIAMVFQNYALYLHMTVRDNMGFALKLAKQDPGEINKRVEEAARILDLEKHLDRKPANLSGGQRQRVAMGRARRRRS